MITNRVVGQSSYVVLCNAPTLIEDLNLVPHLELDDLVRGSVCSLALDDLVRGSVCSLALDETKSEDKPFLSSTYNVSE